MVEVEVWEEGSRRGMEPWDCEVGASTLKTESILTEERPGSVDAQGGAQGRTVLEGHSCSDDVGVSCGSWGL
jgi:hypothetical protein